MTETLAGDLPGPTLLVPPHGRNWAILALAMGGFAIGTGEFSMMGLLPSVAGSLHVTVPHAGMLISFYALGVVIGAPLITVLCARMPRRRLLMGLMALYAVGNLLSATSDRLGTVGLFRFLSGLPHGAYFGVACLVAASMVDHGQRAQAVGRVMLGLTVATILGAPLAAWCGSFIDWHLAYWVVGGLSVLTVGLLTVFLPAIPPPPGASPLTELGALGRLQVWLALATGAVGFGGLFAVYSYIAPALISLTHMSAAAVPLVLVVLGLGMALGNTVGAYFADRALRQTIVAMLLWDGLSSLLFVPALPFWWAVTGDAFLIGFGVALAPALQTRLMDVAANAQALAAALNHSAFNIANALGAFLAGIAITAGYGWSAAGWVGACMAMGGLAIFLVALAAERVRPRDAGAAPGAAPSAGRA
jgi:DHA1 family inner membrane transport protein